MCRMMDKNFYLLNMNEESRKVFFLRPTVLFYSRKVTTYWDRSYIH